MKSHHHSPLHQGNPGGCCPEYGIKIFDEKGEEWEKCPCCNRIGKVYVLGPESLLTPNEIAKKCLEIIKNLRSWANG